jgi:segregation and condensation protein A
MSYEFKLDVFEGPLDLLLYLIRKNEVDIYNIPIAMITEQYLQHIEVMKALNLDVAGEYLVMASTLILIKSKMLLPAEENEEGEAVEGDDPRGPLIQQLLEYQAFKEAALNLAQRPLLGRDTFKRDYAIEESEPNEEEEEFVELGVFDLIEAFRRIVSTLKKEELMEIDVERISLTDRINEIMERLQTEKDLTFEDLLDVKSRKRIIYTLLAVLELVKLRVIRAYQSGPFGTIRIFASVEEGEAETVLEAKSPS